MKSIAIIGAGPSGLAQLRAFKSIEEKGVKIPKITCFEKQEDWGGLWNYTWRTGVDKFCNHCHGSMYRYLWSNGPKEGLEFADYSFEEHFGKQIASYPPRAVLFDYIKGRVEKANVRNCIHFNTIVRDVRYNKESANFTILARDCVNDSEASQDFDCVIVASGHFSYPNVPYYQGFKTFKGRILHAHDFRDALEFKNQDILILGTSYSAEDIGSQCWKYGAKSITVSHRTAPMGFKWPDNWQEVPALLKVSGNTAYFKDGSVKDVSAIILCTGYKHHFPFLGDDLRLKTANRLATADLYKGVVWNKNPKMFYLGMQDQWYTFNMFDAQAWYVRDIILGRINLPSYENMQEDVKARVVSEDALLDDYDAIKYQGDYVKELISTTDYPSFDVDASNQAFFQWKKHKKENIMAFRDNQYISPITKTMAPIFHTPWKDALDDSLEVYLQENPE